MENQRTVSLEELNRRTESPRRIVAAGPRGAECEYEIASLPDGRYAMRYDFRFPGFAGSSSGWHGYDSREQCVAIFRSIVLSHCGENQGGCMTKANKAAVPILKSIFDPNDLFGFQEPEPLPRAEWLPERAVDTVNSMTFHQNFDLLDVVRGGNYRPISPAKDGNFFEIPVPWAEKRWHNEDEEEDDDEEE